jgi:hypothetical protein
MDDEFRKMFCMAMMYSGFTVYTSTWSRLHVHVDNFLPFSMGACESKAGDQVDGMMFVKSYEYSKH